MKNFFNNYFSSVDIYFSRFIASFTQQNKEDLSLAAALVSRYVRDGHICLDLNDIAGKIIFKSEDGKNIIECPQLKVWLASLKSASCVGEPGNFKPLILDEKGRLYLQRYWQYEKDVAEYVSASISKTNEIKLDKVKLQKKLTLYFDESSKQKINWQKVAAIAALSKKFLVISCSPGTGKTTAITKIMALILDIGNISLRIALVAPTGKAAARLQESVKKTKEKLNCIAAIKEMIPNEAQTIHRLLGSISNSPYFQFNKKIRYLMT
jgi:exodeoxyribonuclease V alpha subunit